MDKIYQDLKDQHVAKYLIYVGETNSDGGKPVGFACKDAEGTKIMNGEELFDAVVKGAFIVYRGTYNTPSKISPGDSGTICKCDIITLVSSELGLDPAYNSI